MQICPGCGEENPDKFRLCGYCGTQLAVPLLPQEVRKTVSVVFCDLKGSTSLGERLDTESLREVLNHYFREMKRILERHGGTVEKFIGDAIMAVFGLPRAHEDDALRAVRAAAEMREALIDINEELLARWGVTLANRTGVNTGEVVAGDVASGQRLVTGDTVNTAARLEQAAPETQVLIGESTYRLVKYAVEVEPVQPLELKGKAERVPAYRLISVSGEEAFTRHLDVPMVGRMAEMGVLGERFGRALVEGTCQLVTVIGQAGVGKSRLIQELVASIQAQGRVLRGRCLPYGEGITFWPMAEITREAAGILPDDPTDRAWEKLGAMQEDDATEVAERVAAAIGLSSESFPIDETFWAFRKLLESLAARQPLVLVIDDIHWAEPTLLDLVEHLADGVHQAPMMVVCSSRQDLLEERPQWGEGRPNAINLVLEPLSAAESEQIVSNNLGDSLPSELRDRIVSAAEGNPLFVEQMISMLVDEGVVIRDEVGSWRVLGDPTSFSVPPSIFALLTARLDRLGREERSVAERGSVIGHVFYGGAVTAMCSEDLKVLVPAQLSALTRKQLIRPDRSDLADEDAFRFHHILIRDAAYQSLLKRARIDFHEAFADWLERAAASLLEFEEVVGYHLEQGYRYRLELGPLDDTARQVGARAAKRLAAAGKRAFARGDMPAAVNLLERAASILPSDDPLRLALMPDLGEALKDLGEFSRAVSLLDEAIEGAVAIADQRLEMEARLVRQLLRYAQGLARAEEVLGEIGPAIPVLERARDDAALARAWRLAGIVHITVGRYGAAEEAVLRGKEHARLAGNRRQETRNLSLCATCAVYGPTPALEAIRRCEDMLEEAHGDRRGEALLELALSQLYAMVGDFDRARDFYHRSRAILLDLGERVLAATTASDSGRVEMMAEDFAAAESELVRDFEALDAMGEKYHLATIAALLAHALYLQGRHEEADRLTRIAEAADEDDIETQSLWRRARAKVLARWSRFEEAERLARESLDLITGVDSPGLQAGSQLDFAEVLLLAGHTEEAIEAAEKAVRLFEQKGNVVSAQRARRYLVELTAAPVVVGLTDQPPVAAAQPTPPP